MTAWADMLRRAMTMGLAPRSFWRLSLKEWSALTAPPGPPGLERARLDSLMIRFPDDYHGDQLRSGDDRL